jgi:hypothetical protein
MHWCQVALPDPVERIWLRRFDMVIQLQDMNKYRDPYYLSGAS